MNYRFRRSAEKQFAKFDPSIQSMIVRKLEYFVSLPNPLSLAKRLKHFHSGQYRFRIGDYRVAFDVEGDTIIVLAVGNRRDIYR